MSQQKFWIGVVCADHVARGRAGGFMQVNHGKLAPLRRLNGGDGMAYYSPTQKMGVKDGLQSFTAIGRVKDNAPYQADMGDGFTPYRRDVTWAEAQTTPIRPLLDKLDLTRGKSSWGYAFRFGLIQISAQDFSIIAQAMAADIAISA